MSHPDDIHSIYDSITKAFFCPACKKHGTLSPNSGGTHCIPASCSACGAYSEINLPAVEKAVIYLDQWYISDALNDTGCATTDAVMALLKRLVAEQRIKVVMSDLNVHETAKGPNIEKSNEQFDLFHYLSNGETAGLSPDSVTQQMRHVRERMNGQHPWQDCFEHDPNSWEDRSGPIRVVTRGLLGFDRNNGPSGAYMNAGLREILERQLNELPDNADLAACVSYMQKMYVLDFRDAAEYMLRSMGPIGSRLPLGEPNGAVTLFSTIKTSFELTKQEFLELLKYYSDIEFDSLPSIFRVNAAFEAKRLHLACEARRQGRDFSNKRFNEQYGYSASNDSSHIANFLPYVDHMLVDNKTRALIGQEPVAQELKPHRCEFYSKNNLADFLAVLADISNIERSKEVELGVLFMRQSGF